MIASAVRVCLLLIAACGAAAECDGASQFELLTSGCPTAPMETAAASVASEAECAYRCSLIRECRLSVHLRDSSACHSLPAVTSPEGECGSGMTVRRKLDPKPTALMSLSFWQQVVLFYNFRKDYRNLANLCQHPAQPVNVAEQNSIDGVRLRGSSSSYVRVSTPGFYRYFLYGQKFSIFFQGKLVSNFSSSCFSTFVDVTKAIYSSYMMAKNDGRIEAKILFPKGNITYKSWTSPSALVLDSVQRDVSFGISFEGGEFAPKAYFNGSSLTRSSWGSGTVTTDRVLLNIHDNLLIGNCMNSGIGPFDGWLQCWALLTGNLSLSQFDQLRSLCNA